MTHAVATSDPRATALACSVLDEGGAAVDAAVAAALLLFVVEPQSCGIGGDAFLIHAGPGSAPVALDGSGAMPVGLTQEALEADGFDTVPPAGARSVTVPGAVALFETALHRFGRRTLAECARPAIDTARGGFTVRPHLAEAVARAAEQLVGDALLGPIYVPGGRPVAEGEQLANPALAAGLEALAAEGAAALYDGALADDLVSTVQAAGGYLTAADLAGHRTEEVEAARTEFLGRVVLELPHPTQGPAVLHALDALDVDDSGPVDWAGALEAVRHGMRVAGFDPGAIKLSKPPEARGDTTYLAVIDDEGSTASLITSVFGAFGSHLGVPAIGGPIHNRATTLRMVGEAPRPGKPPHTTIPAMVLLDDAVEYALGVAGGLMQPQTQVQVLLRMLVEGLDPQAAIDAPRFKICFGGDTALEAGHPLLERFPGAGERAAGPEGFGACQVAGRHRGTLRAGADHRRGGAATVHG